MSRPKIFHLIHMAHRALFRAADRLLAERHDITAAQNALLLYLEKNEGASMSAVAAAIGLKNAATSGLVDRMEHKELIARRPSAQDRRSFELVLLPKGRAIARESHTLIHATNDHLLDGFTEAEQATIARFLETVMTKSDAFEIGTIRPDEKQSA
ncbi:MarR family winged helix-turn-helix transcriptional regulator [Kordiimonas lacus]|uniref:DNA-binding transcriptional regulator, MarR family n=1 Tax=Kordiimonas lacus TaxID=637679 RepID=A0A1G7DQ44_9PROT|nr:MarR family transcriptional regulator [Kordiimonas lacus]SDE53539.1 DNA-binding transcriptional regulator, MarR family [Kordiimonas lacus]